MWIGDSASDSQSTSSRLENVGAALLQQASPLARANYSTCLVDSHAGPSYLAKPLSGGPHVITLIQHSHIHAALERAQPSQASTKQARDGRAGNRREDCLRLSDC